MDTLPLHAQDGNPPLKRCTGLCGRTLPATSEYFHSNGVGKGLRPECKECKGKKAKAHYQKPEAKERILASRKEYRDRPDKKEHIRTHKKEYYSRPEIRENKRNYTRKYRTRPEVIEKRKAESKAYLSRPEVREHKLEREREYLARPEVRERKRSRDRVIQHTRRSRKREIQGSATPEQIQGLLKRQKHKCYYCATKLEKSKGRYIYHVDHTFPLSRVTGTDIPANDISYLVITCPTCNLKKNDKFPWEFPEGGRLL